MMSHKSSSMIIVVMSPLSRNSPPASRLHSLPNIVQTLENNIAIIHGGPFANIAHGRNTYQATNAALKLADYCVTEAGFGADLGAEKFVNIKCRLTGLTPSCAVIVATVKALKHHGGAKPDQYKTEGVDLLKQGLCNLDMHVDNNRNEYGLH